MKTTEYYTNPPKKRRVQMRTVSLGVYDLLQPVNWSRILESIFSVKCGAAYNTLRNISSKNIKYLTIIKRIIFI